MVNKIEYIDKTDSTHQHPIQGFVGKTIKQIKFDGDAFSIKFSDNSYGTIHIGVLFDKEKNNPYEQDLKEKKIYIVAGLYPDDFVPNVLK